MTQRQLDRVYVVVADAVPQRGAFDEATIQRGSKLAALGNCVSICPAARASGNTSRLYCGIVRRGTVRTSVTSYTAASQTLQLAADLSRPSP